MKNVSGGKTAKLVDEILSMPEDAKKSLSFLVRTEELGGRGRIGE